MARPQAGVSHTRSLEPLPYSRAPAQFGNKINPKVSTGVVGEGDQKKRGPGGQKGEAVALPLLPPSSPPLSASQLLGENSGLLLGPLSPARPRLHLLRHLYHHVSPWHRTHTQPQLAHLQDGSGRRHLLSAISGHTAFLSVDILGQPNGMSYFRQPAANTPKHTGAQVLSETWEVTHPAVPCVGLDPPVTCCLLSRA